MRFTRASSDIQARLAGKNAFDFTVEELRLLRCNDLYIAAWMALLDIIYRVYAPSTGSHDVPPIEAESISTFSDEDSFVVGNHFSPDVTIPLGSVPYGKPGFTFLSPGGYGGCGGGSGGGPAFLCGSHGGGGGEDGGGGPSCAFLLGVHGDDGEDGGGGLSVGRSLLVGVLSGMFPIGVVGMWHSSPLICPSCHAPIGGFLGGMPAGAGGFGDGLSLLVGFLSGSLPIGVLVGMWHSSPLIARLIALLLGVLLVGCQLVWVAQSLMLVDQVGASRSSRNVFVWG